jgi:hypothetical protein
MDVGRLPMQHRDYEEILSNKNGVQTQQSIALINGLEKVLGKGSLSCEQCS